MQEHLLTFEQPWTDESSGRTLPVCSKCQAPLRLIALIKTEDVAKKVLTAMHLPTDIPELHPARPPPRAAGGIDDWVN